MSWSLLFVGSLVIVGDVDVVVGHVVVFLVVIVVIVDYCCWMGSLLVMGILPMLLIWCNCGRCWYCCWCCCC